MPESTYPRNSTRSTPRIAAAASVSVDAPFAERFVRRDDARLLLAELAACRDHEHDPVPVGLGPGHRAAARDLGVVGVGVEGHEGGGHDEHPDRTPRDMIATVRLLSQRET